MRRRLSLKALGILLTILGFAATFWMIFLRGWQVMRDLKINYSLQLSSLFSNRA